MTEENKDMTSTVVSAVNNLPEAGLNSYLQKINSLPVLSKEEELDLAKKYHDTGDLESAQKLVLFNMRYVIKVARGYSGYGLGLSDLVQEGAMGLMKAVKRFDPNVGVRLVTFAVRWIKAEMQEYVIKNWKVVKVATTKAQRKLFFNLRSSKKHLGWATREEVEAIAKDLDVTTKDVLDMEIRMNSNEISLYGFDDDSSEDSNNFSPLSYLPSPEKDPQEILVRNDFSAKALSELYQSLEQLDERSKDILKQRWLNNDGKVTLSDLAKKYSISLERVRQLEKTAIEKLRKQMKELSENV